MDGGKTALGVALFLLFVRVFGARCCWRVTCESAWPSGPMRAPFKSVPVAPLEPARRRPMAAQLPHIFQWPTSGG